MKISNMNWMQVEGRICNDDRAVVPLGSTEQHAYLSLSVDSILSERVAVDAAEPLGVPVFSGGGLWVDALLWPIGTITLRMATYVALVRDILDSLARTGFRRILIVNGHGGNSPVEGLTVEWMADNPIVRIKFYDWWRGPQTWAAVQAIDPVASHASWMENFPWTRLAGAEQPDVQKPMSNRAGRPRLVGQELRAALDDGNFGGYYQRSDDEMLSIWQVAVAETRALIEEGWD
ncbi:MAG: creatininase family protein [Caldilineaceae bacterium]